jgi:hypothetical protein
LRAREERKREESKRVVVHYLEDIASKTRPEHGQGNQ